MITKEELKKALDENFWGTTQWHRVPHAPFLLTDGVKFFVDNAECYWFLHTLTGMLKKVGPDWFYSIELFVQNSCAVITIDDGNGKVLATHSIDFTDCPEGSWKFFLESDGEESVLLLPTEH